MAYQLVYTSAAKLLDAGRSGFGTVARSKSINSLVVSAIERASQFANLRGLDRSRVIHVHRRITAGSSRFHVLTRIVDAGVDYTGRTNHIAHHLVVSHEEANKAAARGVTPADVLRQFPWLDRWDGSARYFDPSEDVPLDVFWPDGKNGRAQYWTSVTGNPSHARLLAWDGSPRTGVWIVPDGANPLSLMAEALAECGAQSWTRSFTTSLETTDELADLDWIVSTPHTYQDIQPRCGNRTLWDLTAPATLPVPPAPTLPAPQQTTQRKSQETMAQSTVPRPSGVHSRSPYIAPVKMHSAESETWTEDAPRRATRAQLSKKKNPLLLAGACAALVAALIVVGMVTKSGKEEASVKEVSKSKEESNDHADANNRINAVEELKKAGIYEKDAEIIVKAVGPDKCSLYKELVINLSKTLTKAPHQKDWINLEIYAKLDNTKIDWLSALVSSCKEMHGYQKMHENMKFAEKIKILDSIHDQLKIVAESKKLEVFKLDNCDGFVQSMIEYEITDLQKNPEKFKGSIEEAVKYEKDNKRSTRRDIVAIARLINDKNVNAQKEKISEILTLIENNSKIEKQKGITANPKSNPPEAQKNQKQIPPEPAKKTLDTNGLKSFEITLVDDRCKLDKVKSMILDKVLKDVKDQEKLSELIEISIDDGKKPIIYSNWMECGTVYGDHLFENDRNISIDKKERKIVLEKKPNWNTIKIILNYESKKYYHFIAFSNDRSKDLKNPIITEELQFEFEKVYNDNDTVKIGGQAGILLDTLTEKKYLKFYCKDKLIDKENFPGLESPPALRGENWQFSRKAIESPKVILFVDKSKDELDEKLDQWDKKKSSSTESKKLRDQTYESLKQLVGYYTVNKQDNKWNHNNLQKEDIFKQVKDHYKVKSEKDDIKSLLIEIGNLEISKVYDGVMSNQKNIYSTWKLMDNATSESPKQISSIRRFIELTKKPIERKPYNEELAKVLTEITVKNDSRVLFTARLKQP